MKKTTRDLAIEQMSLMDKIRKDAKINMVTCGNCGTVLLHVINNKSTVKCFGCKRNMAKSDCPDYWYEGCQDNAEFNDK